MSVQQAYQNWRVATDADQIVWLWLDRYDSNTNTLNKSVLEELRSIIELLTSSTTIRGLIIASAKSNGFIAGADIEQFSQFSSAEEATALIRKGQEIFDLLANFPLPTVAMIEGFCLGGGLELALACRYRIAEDSKKTRLGLPEIQLGIHPGWGGTVRLPRLIGVLPAMDLILTGRTVNAKAAKSMGFVDEALPKRHLQRAARQTILDKPKPHHASLLQKLTNTRPLRHLLATLLRKKVAQKASQDHYPAPYAVIDNWVRDGAKGTEAFINEANSIGKLILTSTSRNLVRVFFLQELLKSLGKNINFEPQHIHVIGSGVMGGDIAAWCSLRGMTVTLQDREPQFIAPAIKRAADLFSKILKNPRLIQDAMDRLIPDLAGEGIAKADIIIEAISENVVAKQNLFKDVETKCKADAILATNTSSIPLNNISSVLRRPERLVGIHFFNPVAKMMLVEIVQDTSTNQSFVNKAIAFVRKIDRLPLPVKSTPGFLVNRVLMPYLIEAIMLLNENVPAEDIDNASLEFGMPMGPIELADTVGLDICLSVAEHLPEPVPSHLLEKIRNMVAAGQLGRKSNQGFYKYRKGKIIKKRPAKNHQIDPVIGQRLILRMINEAMACKREKVVASSDLLDAGMIFGTGFAPFRGGPMHYARVEGNQKIVQQLQKLQQQFGERFTPDEGWMVNEE